MSDALSLTAAQVEKMNEQDAQAALAAWVKARRAELPEALASSKSKPHAKLAKKALYELRSSGLAVATPKPAEALAAPIQTPVEEFPCVLSAILGTGERAVFFVRPVRGGGLDVYQGIINDERGVMQLEGGTAKRAAYRKRIDELQSDPTLKVLLVPWERMALELGRALTMNERTMTKPAEGAMDLLRKLAITPANPDWDVPAPVTGDDALVATAAGLHETPELTQWLPSEPAIADLGTRVEDLELANEPQKVELARAKAHETAGTYLTVERRKTYARRLWAMAELFDRTERPQVGELARAEARHLFHGTTPSRFIEAMFDAVVTQRRAALEQTKAKAHEPVGRLPLPTTGR
jgi:hypothetical protein